LFSNFALRNRTPAVFGAGPQLALGPCRGLLSSEHPHGQRSEGNRREHGLAREQAGHLSTGHERVTMPWLPASMARRLTFRRWLVRWIGWLSLLLLALGWLAAEVPLDKARPDESLGRWRRTVDGWERPGWCTPQGGIHRPSLHPLVVGLLQGLLASAALVCLSPTAAHRPTARTQSGRFSRQRPPGK
jgi:hypothetical protein